eukprot:m.27591 g.27591  ORF g.27591 m.27591 type:complete len:272 (-) comp4436_c0_seq2:13-828(-)
MASRALMAVRRFASIHHGPNAIVRTKVAKPAASAGPGEVSYVMPNRPKTPPNYGSLSSAHVEQEQELRERTEDEVELLTPVILRPDTVLGDQRESDNVHISRLTGFSKNEIEELTNAERLNAVDFLHLTLPVVEEQTDKLKPLCEPFKAPAANQFVRFITRELYDGEKATHPLSYKVTLKVNVADLKLSPTAESRLAALVEKRLDAKTNILTLNSDRFPSAEANKLYLTNQLRELVKAAKARNACLACCSHSFSTAPDFCPTSFVLKKQEL